MRNNFDNKVVQHNNLIKGVAKMDQVPLKIFELCVSAIDTKNPPKDNIIHLSKQELFKFFDVKDTNKNTRFKESIETLHKQAVFKIENTENNKNKYSIISPIQRTDWNDYDDIVSIEFSYHIMPYLINLKENFTQYLIRDIGNLSSKYSIILYKWLTMNYNQYEKYSNFDCKNPKIKVSELRRITNTEKEYSRFTDLQKWVIDNPIEDINQNTHYTITYEKIKKGKRIDEIQFYIDSKVEQLTIPYDKTYAGKSNKDIQNEKNLDMLPQALQNKYVLRLKELGLITFNDVQDIVNIFVQVVPIYERIDSEWINTQYGTRQAVVDRHLVHVSQYIINDVKKYQEDKTKYLKISISDYEQKLENKRIENVEKRG